VKRDAVSDWILVLVGIVIGAALVVPMVYHVAYTQGAWEQTVVACEPNEYRRTK